MSVFPWGQGFSLGAHTVQVRMICQELPGSHYSYERLRITSSGDPIAQFASLEVGTCSVGSSEVECPLLLGETDQYAELHGDLQFQDSTYLVDAISAQFQTEDDNGVSEWHDIPVTQLLQGFVLAGPAPKKCARRDFKVNVLVSAGLRQQLIDAATFGGEISDEVPQFIARLERQGKKVSKQPRLPDLKYKSDLNGFKIKVPAARLPSGRYGIRVFLELNSPDDYPEDVEKFKRC